ncbi:F-actin-monooxygenase mical2b isoform X4 [Gadus macrocephalus]|uniref:F-actin-monooxygenase mical2b isoform X4 n=1 Tax=Gadus macrocephalus TaxID=80720 RepID=UPI0028CB3254|nr:F-actin-monooxygenase mical2b isoform X4 [Gadus macrocephalus]
MGETEDERTAQAGQLFETFVQATTCKGTLQAFSILCRQMDLDPLDYTHFYSRLKAAISSWKVKSLWTKLDKRAGQKVYNHGEACQGTKCLIVGGGPCGLRTAIELALLGCKVVVIEKRDTFSRNNVLHLWPYTIHDLRALGAKNFYGKFCAGSLDHISIRQLQLMLIKVCLILGVEIHVNVEFVELLEPREDQSDSDSPGWRVAIRPSDHPVTEIDFDVVIGADGRKNTLDGFSRKEFRGKLAIAITANFVNRNTTAEASVEEISGVAFIFNQKFFLDLKEETGIDLENIVYYKDNTHYFVMTAKKQSLLDKGVILNDHMETERLLHRDNIDNEALRSYAREAADFGTNYQLPSLDYAVNSYDQPDVTMFDFTSMYASENAALLRERHGRQVLVALVGDSLLEPFWPMGTGCARGFLAAFDTAWMVRGWTQGRSPLDVLAERESLYRLLPQTTTENINKHFEQYSIEPSTRYPNLNSSVIRPHQVRHLLMNGQEHSYPVERRGPSRRSTNFSSTEAVVHQSELLTWCQKQTQDYRGVEVTDLGSSWRDGLALCSLIHHQRPDLIDFESLAAEDSASNNQLAFDLAEREFGIQPVTTGKELALEQQPDQLLLVLYLSKFYEAFRRLPGGHSDSNEPDENNEKSSGKTNHTLLNQPHHRKRIPKNDKKLEDNDSTNKKRRKGTHYLAELSCQSAPLAGTDGELQENKDRSMASLLAKFEENSSSTRLHNKGKVSTREFTRRSIKERAGILCSMFPGSSTQPASSSSPPSPPPRPSPETELRTSSSSSSSSSSTNASKSLPLQRAIHSPIPHPSISGVSSTPLLPSHISHPPRGPEEKPDTSLPARPNESKHKHNPEKGHSSDKHRDNGHRGTPSPPAGSGVQRVCQTVAALSHTNDVCAAAQTMPAATTDGFKVNVERGEESFSGGSLGMLNGCKLTESVQEKSAGSGALFNSRRITRKPVARSDRCPAGPQKYSKERTVGKVSSAIDAKAQKLAILYETINRPNATPGSVRKATAPGLGGSDTCHFCLKRVYIMERLSAEGHFFHRECFRCAACGCTLRLGTHSFDSQQGNFYCKNHVKQRLGTKPDAFKKKMSDHNGVGTSGSSSLSSSRATNGLPAAGPHAPTSGGHAGLFVVSGQGAQKGLPGTCPVAGMVEEVLEATEASADTGGHKDSDPPCPDKSSRWKRKIRAAFPLLFVKRSSSEAKAGPAESAVRRQSIREEDSKDGQLLGGKQSAPSGNSGGVGGGDVSKALAEKRPVSSDRREEETAPVPSSGPKKRLMMTAFEKQKLLDWDLPLTSDTPTPRLEDQVPPMSRSKPDQSQTDVGRVEDPISDQTPASPLSTFQLFTNSLRKSFSGNRTSSSFNAAASVIIPTSSKPEGPHKPKVPSNSLFGLGSGQPQPESGKDLPAVMRGLSLAGQQGSAEGAFSDDMATLPPRRKLNFFSSLRLRKRDASQSESVEVDGQDKVRAILANLRNKASSEQHLEESLSSDDEEPCQSANQKVSLERQRKQQEKTVAQHAKREQLKRLHRAQAIQRHLEEVGERQRVVEERGVTLEKSLRGETGETHRADEETENQLHQSWFNLVLEKNRLARYESELMIFAQELELQDTQCRLQQDLRRKMAIEDTTKSASELQGEQELLSELMRTVERRDTLVSLLEEQRLSERDEDRDLESLSRGYELHWSPGQSLGWWDNLEGSGVEPGSQGDTLG